MSRSHEGDGPSVSSLPTEDLREHNVDDQTGNRDESNSMTGIEGSKPDADLKVALSNPAAEAAAAKAAAQKESAARVTAVTRAAAEVKAAAEARRAAAEAKAAAEVEAALAEARAAEEAAAAAAAEEALAMDAAAKAKLVAEANAAAEAEAAAEKRAETEAKMRAAAEARAEVETKAMVEAKAAAYLANEAEVPASPAVARYPAHTIELLVVPPSPAAERFMSKMSTVSEELGTLRKEDVIEGMYQYYQVWKNGMQNKFVEFKTHTLDLAVTAFADQEPGTSRRSQLSKQVNGRELLKLPLAGVYALFCLLCLAVFAALHYPSLYGPIVVSKSKQKLVEWKVADRALEIKAAAMVRIGEAYRSAAMAVIVRGSGDGVCFRWYSPHTLFAHLDTGQRRRRKQLRRWSKRRQWP